MKDQSRTKQALIQELASLRKRITELEQSDLERKRVEENLLLIKGGFESAGDAIGISDIQGRHIYQNKSFTDLFEYTVEELEAAGGGRVAFSDINTARDVFDAIMNGRSWSGETEMKSKSGRSFPVFLRANAVKDDTGRMIFIFGTFTDITERKLAEEELMDLAAELTLIYENAPFIMMLVDKEWTIRKTNAFASQFVGRAIGDMINLRCGQSLRCIHSLDAPDGCGFGPSCRECTLRLAAINTIKTGQGHHEVETRMSLSDGVEKREAIFLLSTSKLTVKRQPMALVGMQDITERKKAEEALRESEKRLRTIVEASLDAIIAVNIEGRLVLFNGAAQELFKYSEEEALNQPVDILLREDKGKIHQERLEKFLKKGVGRCGHIGKRTEKLFRRKDGSLFEAEVSMSGGRLDGLRLMVLVIRDITERKRAEEALRESEMFARATLDGLSAHIAIVDESGIIIAVNRLWREFADENPPVRGNVCEGVDYLDVCDRAASEAPEAAQFAGAIRSILHGGTEKFEMEYACHSPDEQRWFVGRVTRFSDSTRPLVVVAHHDITARKLAEEAVRDSERSLKKAQQIGCLGSWEWDIAGGRLTWSDELYRMWGVAKDFALTQDNIAALIHPDDRAENAAKHAEMLESGADVQFEFRIVRPDGATRTLLQIVDVSRDTAGKAVRIVGIMQDITERKKTEVALRESEVRYRNLFENANEAIFVAQDGKLVFLNPITAMLIGYSGEELMSRPFIEFIHPDDRDMVIDRHVRRMKGEEFPHLYSFRIIHRDGNVMWVELNAILINWKGKAATLNFLNDITQRKQVEEVLERQFQVLCNDITLRKQAEERIHASLREKELLLGEVHHRVKNNMQVISGLLDLQARSSGNPELIERLNESQSRIRSMSLIHEKLYGSKDFARIDLADYVRTLSQELFQSYKINPGEIALIVHTDGDVYVDINKAIPCGLILNELISNALKHAFPRDRHGELRIIIRETKNTEIEIVVRDNGLGLPDDIDIHEPRTVGLHLINGLVKNQLDGKIEVRRDNGTEFRIKFPL